MSEDAEAIRQRKIGWAGRELGLRDDCTEEDVLKAAKTQRALEVGYGDSVSWFQIFCAERKAGIQKIPPTYYPTDGRWDENPVIAHKAADLAWSIFSKTEQD